MLPFNISKIFTLSCELSTFQALFDLEGLHNLYLVLGAPFAFWEDFHTIKGKETGDHADLNTTDDNMGLTESISASMELSRMCAWEINSFVFEISFFLFSFFFFLTMLSQNCML
jgi:hypothetical protein